LQPHLLIIGGGAAGFFCAINAARLHPGLRITIAEKTSKLLSKVKVSGGGRCNVTHACFSIAELAKRYPRGGNFLKKTLHHFSPTQTIQWFAERGIALKTEADGRMFPESNSSQTIIDCFLREANQYGISILMNREVTRLQPIPNGWNIHFGNGAIQAADFVCIACGGFAKPAQFNWLTALGHSIETPVPSLFTFNMPGNPITQLMGVSVDDAAVKINGAKLSEQGPLLITHWGMSGPAILRLSAWGARVLHEKEYHFSISVNWLPGYYEQSMKECLLELRHQLATQALGSRNPFALPQRLWVYLLQQSGTTENTRWTDLPAKAQNLLAKNLCAQEFEVKGKTTFKEEFVTSGGIRLAEIDANTMQSRIVPNLYFAGEIMDVDGITGGFNFQHAWTSGWIAAKAIASRISETLTAE
jgi:predicted Rossmann fold flavoprotein